MCKRSFGLGESAIKQLAAIGRAGVPCTVQFAERGINKPKKGLFRRLHRKREQREVRKERKYLCRSVKGFIANLEHVQRSLETKRNLKKKGCKA